MLARGLRVLTAISTSVLSLSNSRVQSFSTANGASAAKTLTKMTTTKQPSNWISLNSDKSKAQLIRTSEIDWVGTSQAGGVYRKMIEREGTEKVARATTIVRFDPDQAFPRHTHAGGEEFLVLDGVWRDDYGAFPKYSYVRNYIGSGHTPSIGKEGCVILVKLRQMSLQSKDEPEHKAWGPHAFEGRRAADGVAEEKLFSSTLEQTAVQTWPANSSFDVTIPKHGAEIFVVDGSFSSELGEHDCWSWARIPNEGDEDDKFHVTTGSDPVYVWIKMGHLASDEIGMESDG